MPRLTPEKLEELHFGYVDAAINIVISYGWGELSMRRLAKEVGKAAATLHEHFTSDDRLRQTLVTIAFNFAHWIEPQPEGEAPLTSIEEAELLLKLAKGNAQEAALMTQVTANAALPTSPLHRLYRDQHQETVDRIAEKLPLQRFIEPVRRLSYARRLVGRYIGICAMITADPSLTEKDAATAIT